MAANGLLVLAVLFAAIAAAEWLTARTALRHAGSALVVIVIVAVLANLGVVPTGSSAARPVPVYDAILGHVGPLAIFALLLRVQLRRVLSVGPVLLGLFLLGAAATMLGAVVGLALAGPDNIGAHAPALTGMFAATYIGGSVNWNALALHYGVVDDGALYAGATAVDAGLTTVWMIATLAWPRIARRHSSVTPRDLAGDDASPLAHAETTSRLEIVLLAALGLGCVWASAQIAEALAGVGVTMPSILVVTTLALVLAQVPAVARLRGAATLGMVAVLLLLAVIGALCDVRALAALEDSGPAIALLAVTTIAIHGVIVLGAGLLLRADPVLAAIASQANIGGGTTALAVARSCNREDLVLPAILVGALGNALGTYAGFAVTQWWT